MARAVRVTSFICFPASSRLANFPLPILFSSRALPLVVSECTKSAIECGVCVSFCRAETESAAAFSPPFFLFFDRFPSLGDRSGALLLLVQCATLQPRYEQHCNFCWRGLVWSRNGCVWRLVVSVDVGGEESRRGHCGCADSACG